MKRASYEIDLVFSSALPYEASARATGTPKCHWCAAVATFLVSRKDRETGIVFRDLACDAHALECRTREPKFSFPKTDRRAEMPGPPPEPPPVREEKIAVLPRSAPDGGRSIRDAVRAMLREGPLSKDAALEKLAREFPERAAADPKKFRKKVNWLVTQLPKRDAPRTQNAGAAGRKEATA